MSITLHSNFRFIKKRGADKCVVCNNMIDDKEFCLSIKRRYGELSSTNITIHIGCIKNLCKALTEIKKSDTYLSKKFHGMKVEHFRVGYLTIPQTGLISCSYCNNAEAQGIRIYRAWSTTRLMIGFKCVGKVTKLLRDSIKKYEAEIVANLL